MLDFPESHGQTGKLKKVLHIVKHFSEHFRFYYMPKSKVSIDESLRGFEGPGQQFSICPIHITTILVSNFLAHVRVIQAT